MLFAGWEVRIVKNCARGLEYGLGRYSDRGHKGARGAASGDIFARHLAAHQRIWN